MNPIIFHLFGPFSITWYGFSLVAGLFAFIGAAYVHPGRKEIVSDDGVLDIAGSGIFCGLLGGKLLFLAQEWGQLSVLNFSGFIDLLLGGFAILGAIVGATIGIIFAARWYNVALLPLLDLAGAYALLAHGIARWGCFFAGCCHGMVATSTFFSVVYSNPASLAPLHVPLVPTQLMMSFASLLGFVVCRFIVYPWRGRPVGAVFAWYLLWETAARFVIDFWRGDRPMTAGDSWSFYQYTAVYLIAAAIIVLVALHLYGKRRDA